MNFKVVIGNPRKLKFIWRSDNKNDRRDAEMLARIARFDLELFHPITNESRENQTALAFVLTIGDPGRFRKSRHVGCYLGLVSKRDQSGGIDKKLGITKAGNTYPRSLLAQRAQHIMGPFGEDRGFRAKFSPRIGVETLKIRLFPINRIEGAANRCRFRASSSLFPGTMKRKTPRVFRELSVLDASMMTRSTRRRSASARGLVLTVKNGSRLDSERIPPFRGIL
jgi:hypothetical protein